MEKADDIIDYKAVGKRIKTVRRNKGLSQKALATVMDISATNLSHIDSLTSSKHISQGEIADIVDKCSPKEARIVAATVKAMFEEMHGKVD